MGKATHGINPVTLRGNYPQGEKLCITFARMHVSIGGPLKKFFPITVYEDGPDPVDSAEAEARMKCLVMLDEDQFLDGMYHLFPQGMLDYADQAPEPTNQKLVEGLRIAIAALKGLGADGFTLHPLESILAGI